MITECEGCGQELQEGDKVVRIETVVRNSDDTAIGTTGFSPTDQQFICLDCLRVAFMEGGR